MRIVEKLNVLLFKAAWAIGNRAPEGLLQVLLRLVARVMWLSRGTSVQRLRFNLARVLNVPPGTPEADAAARSALLGYFDYWASIFCLPRRTPRQISERVVLVGEDRVADLLRQGKSVLVIAPHSGNWDLAGAWAAERYGGLTTVAERLEPVEIFDLFVEARTVRAIEILPHKGGARRPLEVLTERLQEGRLVGLAADRDLSRRGVSVQFFGHEARMPAGPAQLALDTGCVVVPLALGTAGNRMTLEYLQPLEVHGDIAGITQSMADAFAAIIRSQPTHWYMLQQVWLDHPQAWGGRS